MSVIRRSLPAGTDIAASGRRPAARDGASRCATSEESGKTTRVAPDEDPDPVRRTMKSTENPYAGQGPVLLDVGGDVGALLVKMPPSWEGVEVELRPEQPAPDLHSHDHTDHSRSLDDEDHAHLRHVEVLPRPTPTGFVRCAVFPELTQGRYELYERPDGPVRLRVSINGGQVTQACWPTPDAPSGFT